MITDATGNIIPSSTISTTELGYLDGLTEAISTSLGNKLNKTATASSVMITDATGNISTSLKLSVANGGTNRSTITANRLLGCITANTVDEITLGTNLSFSGSTLNATAGSDSRWTTVNTTDIYLTNTAGKVGIGTNNPSTQLDILGETAFDGTTKLRILNPASAFGRCHLEMVGRYENNNDAWDMGGGRLLIRFSTQSAQNSAITQRNAIQSYNGNLGFFCNGYSTTTPALTILSAGNVGIGYTQPSYKLDINSNGGFRVANYTAGTGYNGGLLVNWNESGSTGETRFYNYKGNGTGGFHFRNRTLADVDDGLAGINCAGISCAAITCSSIAATSTVSSTGFSAAGNISGNNFVLPTTAASSLNWSGVNSAVGRAQTGGQFSDDAAAGDIVIRSDNKVLIQTGSAGVGNGIKITSTSLQCGVVECYGTLGCYQSTSPSIRCNYTLRISASGSTTNYWDIWANAADTNTGGGTVNNSATGNLLFYAAGQLVGYVEDDFNTYYKMNFTGQHRTISNDKKLYDDAYIGYIVSTNGKYKGINSKYKTNYTKENININDALPVVELSNKAYDKTVFGVITNRIEDQNNNYITGHFVSVYQKDGGDDRLVVNGCGEGSIWVSDYNGILENGDYIVTSPILGIGMKQDNDILRNCTVAKITMDCDFEPKLIPIEVIKQETYTTYDSSNVISYHSSNMLDIEGNPIYEYKLDESSNIIYDYEYNMKYIKLDGNIVDYNYYCSNLDHTYRMAFVGAVYKMS